MAKGRGLYLRYEDVSDDAALIHNGCALVDEGPLHTVGDENPLEHLPVSHLLVRKLHRDPLSIVATAKMMHLVFN